MRWTGPRSTNIEDRRGQVTPPPDDYEPVATPWRPKYETNTDGRVPTYTSRRVPTASGGGSTVSPASATTSGPSLEEMLDALRKRSMPPERDPREFERQRAEEELIAKRDREQAEADAAFERENRVAQLVGAQPRQRTNEPRVQFVGERGDALIYRDNNGKEISVPKTLVTR